MIHVDGLYPLVLVPEDVSIDQGLNIDGRPTQVVGFVVFSHSEEEEDRGCKNVINLLLALPSFILFFG